MIIYATEEPIRFYKLQMPEQLTGPKAVIAQHVIKMESGKPFYEWGCATFEFYKKKCVELLHAASGLTLFLINLRPLDLPMIGKLMSSYLFDIYKDDPAMQHPIREYFATSPMICFNKLTDKGLEARLTRNQYECAQGYDFYGYFEGGILRTQKINKIFNDKVFSGAKDPALKKLSAADAFKTLLTEKFGSV